MLYESLNGDKQLHDLQCHNIQTKHQYCMSDFNLYIAECGWSKSRHHVLKASCVSYKVTADYNINWLNVQHCLELH
jgi:hypothetical protein